MWSIVLFRIDRPSTKDAATQTEIIVETSVSRDSSPGPVRRPSHVYTHTSQETFIPEQEPDSPESPEPWRERQETSSSSTSNQV